MSKIKKAIKNPGYALYVIASRIINVNLRAKVFAHAKEYRSDSENGNYASAVIRALKNQKAFDNFKRTYSYRKILEHVSEDQGGLYLDILEARKDSILSRGLSTVLISDQVGNPIKYNYARYENPLSPTTLRYLKVASDLKVLFGPSLGQVAEIGCGYGGQTLVNDQLLDVKSARLFDLPFVNKLIDRYLNAHLLNGAYATTVINKEEPRDYDLVISNYAFSELPKTLQLAYLKKVLVNSKKGYLTMNSGLGNNRSTGKLTLSELTELLPEFRVIEEEPLTADQNYIIVWGHSEDALEKHFKPLKV
tara:strand:+ start:419 stop:1336 length:918 start_codon:yes stop_codon:yes gene_type:complete